MSAREPAATRDQIIALQSLYARWASHTLDGTGDARAARLAWASEVIGRSVSSFSYLSRGDAKTLIDQLKGAMGQPIGDSPQPWRRIKSRDRAQAAGMAGRREHWSSLIPMAGPDDFARIEQALSRLGWTRDQYESWLRSPRSPIAAGDPAVIRTVTEVNRVWWALKAMLKRSGRWHPGTSTKISSRSVIDITGLEPKTRA